MEINREQFEAWLFSQPREREFIFVNGLSQEEPGCVVCSFLREETNNKRFAVGDVFVNIYKGETFDYDNISFPQWLIQMRLVTLRHDSCSILAGAVQDRYLQLFPNTLTSLEVQPEATSVSVANGV